MCRRRRRRGHPRRPARGARDPEVHDERVIVGRHHDVGGLQIAVHDAGFVCGEEAGRHLLRDGDGAIDGDAAFALQHRPEIDSLNVGHRDVGDAIDLADVVNPHDVGVRDLARQQQLALEAARTARAASSSSAASRRITLMATATSRTASQAW